MNALVKRFLPRDSLVERLVFVGGLSGAIVAVGLYSIPYLAPVLGPAPLVEMSISSDPRYLELAIIMNPVGFVVSFGVGWVLWKLDAPPVFLFVLLAVYVVTAHLWWLGIARACGLVAGLLRRSRSSQGD